MPRPKPRRSAEAQAKADAESQGRRRKPRPGRRRRRPTPSSSCPASKPQAFKRSEAEFKQAAEAEARQKAEDEARHKVEAEAWPKSEAEAMKKGGGRGQAESGSRGRAAAGGGGCGDGAAAHAARSPADPGGVDVTRLRHARHRRGFRAAVARDDLRRQARAQSAGDGLPDRRPAGGLAQGGLDRRRHEAGRKRRAGKNGQAARQNRGNLRCARTPPRVSLHAFHRSHLDKDGRGHASAGPVSAFVLGGVIGCARAGAPGARRMPA